MNTEGQNTSCVIRLKAMIVNIQTGREEEGAMRGVEVGLQIIPLIVCHMATRGDCYE